MRESATKSHAAQANTAQMPIDSSEPITWNARRADPRQRVVEEVEAHVEPLEHGDGEAEEPCRG